MSFNIFEYDFFITGARQNNRYILYGAWSGDIAEAGLHGEFKISKAPNKDVPTEYPIHNSYESDLTEYKKTVFSAVLSEDYTCTNTFYIHTETLYNSNGKI